MPDPCGYIQMNAEGLLNQIREMMIGLLEKGTETLLALMRQEIQRTIHGGAPGKPEWRDELASE